MRGNGASSNPNTLDSSIVPIPLTLTLSPRRGNQPCHLGQSGRVALLPTRKTILPLLGERGGVRGMEAPEVKAR